MQKPTGDNTRPLIERVSYSNIQELWMILNLFWPAHEGQRIVERVKNGQGERKDGGSGLGWCGGGWVRVV